MRRVLSTALLAAVVIGGAACGAKTEQTPTAAMTSSAPAVKTVDKATSCAAIKPDVEQWTLKMLEMMGTLFESIGDPSLLAKAEEEGKAIYTQLLAMTEKHLPTAGDPEVKAALTELQVQTKVRLAAIEAAEKDGKDFGDVMTDEAFSAALDKISDVCPRGKAAS
jgi:hypothetical protein